MHAWPTHYAVQQKLTQHGEGTTFQETLLKEPTMSETGLSAKGS